MAINGFTLPQQYQNIQGDTLGAANVYNPTDPNAFLSNFNDIAPLYSTSGANDEEQANNLIQAYQYLSDPANQATEDAENGAGYSDNLLTQLQSDITEQQQLANYYGGNATPADVGGLETSVGNVGSVTGLNPSDYTQQNINAALDAMNSGNGSQTMSKLGVINGNQSTASDFINNLVGAIQNSNSPMAISAANQAAGNSAQGFQLGATPGNIGEHINGSADLGATATWLASYVQSAQQGYSQLQQLQNTANTEQNNIIQDFTLPSAGAYQQTALQNFYGIDQNGNPIAGDNTGQVQEAQGQAGQNIYQQAYQQRQNINQQANNAGASSSGQRQLALGNVASQASQNASNIYQQDANAAETAINNYNQQIQTSNQQQNALVQQVQGGNLNSLMGTSTQNAINSYDTSAQANNAQSLTNNSTAIDTTKQNSTLWNNIGQEVGTGVGQAAGTAATRI